MSVRRKYGILAVVIATFISVTTTAQNCTRTYDVKENLVSDSLVSVTFPDCTVLIVLSKNQCSNCSRNLPEMVDAFRENDMNVVILRVVDRPLMECKKEELLLADLIEELDFHYISAPDINVNCNNSYEEFQFQSTPFIILSMKGTLQQLPADVLIDEYGRPDMVLVGGYACH